jgi:hypothetical protein
MNEELVSYQLPWPKPLPLFLFPLITPAEKLVFCQWKMMLFYTLNDVEIVNSPGFFLSSVSEDSVRFSVICSIYSARLEHTTHTKNPPFFLFHAWKKYFKKTFRFRSSKMCGKPPWRNCRDKETNIKMVSFLVPEIPPWPSAEAVNWFSLFKFSQTATFQNAMFFYGKRAASV